MCRSNAYSVVKNILYMCVYIYIYSVMLRGTLFYVVNSDIRACVHAVILESCVHHDVLTWKLFPHYWLFVSDFHQSSAVDSSHKDPITQSMDILLAVTLEKEQGAHTIEISEAPKWHAIPQLSITRTCHNVYDDIVKFSSGIKKIIS